jgi:tetratricopeptide (TPR) repeat protein
MTTPEGFVDFYEILQIDVDADPATITEAVRAQRRTWVKRQQAPSVERRREAEDRIRAIDAAETHLTDHERRSAYDRKLATARSRPPVAAVPVAATIDWLDRAKGFLSRNDIESAGYAARQATEQQAGHHEAWSVRARVNYLAGNWKDSIFEYQEAIRLQPSPEYEFDLGSVFESVGRFEESRRAYQGAADMAPHEPRYRVAIAGVLLKIGRPDQALPILEAVHNENPEIDAYSYYLAAALSDNVANYLTLLHNGTAVFTSLRQVEQARGDVNRALSLNFVDQPLRARLTGQLNWAAGALKTTWVFPRTSVGARRLMWVGWVFALYLAFAIPSTMVGPSASGVGFVLGVLLAAGLVWVFLRLYRVPAWKRDEKWTRGAVQRVGIQ